jgi:hypothetical protein
VSEAPAAFANRLDELREIKDAAGRTTPRRSAGTTAAS